MPVNRFDFAPGADGEDFGGSFGGGDFGGGGFGGGDFGGGGFGGGDFGGDGFGGGDFDGGGFGGGDFDGGGFGGGDFDGGGFGGGDFGGDGFGEGEFGGERDLARQKKRFSSDTPGVRETGLFGGRTAGSTPACGGLRWRDGLPELWGVDLALILISVLGAAVILLNLPAVLFSIARAICAVLSLSATAAVILALAAAGLTAVFHRRRW